MLHKSRRILLNFPITVYSDIWTTLLKFCYFIFTSMNLSEAKTLIFSVRQPPNSVLKITNKAGFRIWLLGALISPFKIYFSFIVMHFPQTARKARSHITNSSCLFCTCGIDRRCHRYDHLGPAAPFLTALIWLYRFRIEFASNGVLRYRNPPI